MDGLIRELKALGYLQSERIEKALRAVDRKDFVPEKYKDQAYANVPLPIGYGQTTSQPLTIVFMLEQAEVKEGDKILEIGTGSGWQTALLAELVGPTGYVVSIERIREIHDFANKNLAKYSYQNIQLVVGDGSKGYNREAPYDVIIAGAEAQEVPQAWKEQLALGGRLVFPMGTSVYKLTKKKDGGFDKEEHHGFVFVPLVEDSE